MAIKIKLTSRGRASLRGARRIKLTAKVSFTAAAGPAAVTRKAFTLVR